MEMSTIDLPKYCRSEKMIATLQQSTPIFITWNSATEFNRQIDASGDVGLVMRMLHRYDERTYIIVSVPW
jgi:hypothetical protein